MCSFADVTQKWLDAHRQMTDNESVKHFTPVCLVLAAAATPLLTSCWPKPTDPEQLRAVHEQNAEIRREISRMNALIKHAGEDVPGLAENIAAREAEIAAAIKELDKLSNDETNTRLRVIELQDRLDAFRAAFRMMQNDIANRRS